MCMSERYSIDCFIFLFAFLSSPIGFYLLVHFGSHVSGISDSLCECDSVYGCRFFGCWSLVSPNTSILSLNLLYVIFNVSCVLLLFFIVQHKLFRIKFSIRRIVRRSVCANDRDAQRNIRKRCHCDSIYNVSIHLIVSWNICGIKNMDPVVGYKLCGDFQ